ncbi:MAG TPA: CocE/NonD family hydrolase, partial [Candidatus Binataceae bacterium]|nr:CocE/NonD family hydrolase [Candidatus Binataceae bacterium]
MAKVSVEKDIPLPMRDGVTLKGDLYRPDSNERLPVLLNRTPYGKGGPLLASVMDPIRAAAHGYNVFIVDCRGRFNSAGTWNCFMVESQDG